MAVAARTLHRGCIVHELAQWAVLWHCWKVQFRREKSSQGYSLTMGGSFWTFQWPLHISTQISGIFSGLPEEHPNFPQYFGVTQDLPQISGVSPNLPQFTPKKFTSPKSFLGVKKTLPQISGVYPKILGLTENYPRNLGYTPKFWGNSQSTPEFWGKSQKIGVMFFSSKKNFFGGGINWGKLGVTP